MAAKTSWHRYGTKLRHCHPVYNRRKHPMGPAGRVPSNFGDHGDQVYFVPSDLQLAVTFSLREVCVNSPDVLAKFKGRRKEQ